MPGEVLLNGNRYSLAGPIAPYTVEQYPPAFRTTTVQRRADNSPVNHWITKSVSGGMGLARIDFEEPKHLERFIDATIETRFKSMMTLALNNQESTEPTGPNYTRRLLRAFAEFKGDLWSVWSGDDGSNSEVFVANYVGASTAWDNEASVVYGLSVDAQPFDMIVGGGKLIVLYGYQNDHLIRNSTDGATWSADRSTVTANLLANNLTGTEDIDAGKLAAVGEDIYAFLWDENNLTTQTLKSSTSGDSWAAETVTEIQVGDGIKGTAIYFDLNGDPAPIVVTRDAVYAYDTSAPAYQLIFSLPPHPDNGRLCTVWNGVLYVSTGFGLIYALVWDGTRYIAAQVGPNRDGGLPTEMLSFAYGGWATTQWLFVAWGGSEANRNGRILAFDGVGWHTVHRNSTTNRRMYLVAVSSSDDGTMRLHLGIRTAANAADTQFLQNPLDDPVSGIALVYKSAGYIDLPEFDGGDPHEQKCFLRVRIQADDLSATNGGEYINIDYGTDGVANDDTDLGDILSGTLTRDWGSGRGLSARTLSPRVNLLRDSGNTSQSPKLKEVEVLYEVRQTPLQGFTIPLDLEATQDASERDIETLISELETARDSTILVQFAYGEVLEATPLNVRVVSLGSLDSAERRLANREISAGERFSRPTIVVEQRMPP
jgi:hypothetical protein